MVVAVEKYSKCIESILVYGVSGAGKTTQIQELAKYIYRTTGKITRLVSMSGGGWTSIQPAVDAGLIIPTYIRGREFPIETLDKVTKGYWPIDPQDPTSKLIPVTEQKDWARVGGVAFDGITEGCDWMMSYINSQEASGKIKISAQSSNFKDGGTSYGSPSMAHYGNVQSRISDFVAQSKALRGVYTMWTALELKSTDDNTRLPLYGPDICGKAKTAGAAAWFDNTLHIYLTGMGGLKKGAVVRRLYLSNHFEDDGIPYVAKNRGHFYFPLPEFLEGRECSLDAFLTKLNESHGLAKAQLMNELGMSIEQAASTVTAK
jgi:energy-coupling factor transporter ATP-binding protein EcfA2